MCIITRFPVIPRGCMKPLTKHVILMSDIEPCPERLAEAQPTRQSINRTAAFTKAEVKVCPSKECKVIDSFSARIVIVQFQATGQQSCPICTGKMTQVQALSGKHDRLPAQYAALPSGQILKDPGLPDLARPPYLEPDREFTFDPYHYRNAFTPHGFWSIWNRCCILQHEQKERLATTKERLGLRLMLNQIQKFKEQGDSQLRTWNQELLLEAADADLFEEDAEGNLRLRSRKV